MKLFWKGTITEQEHGMLGFGSFTAVFQQTGNEYTFTAKYDLLNMKKQYKGKEARKYGLAYLKTMENSEFDRIKMIAAESTETPVFMLRTATRKESVVASRYLTFWYIRKVMKSDITLEALGAMFGLHHSTVLSGIEAMEEENAKYLKPIQRVWRDRFIERLKEEGLYEKEKC